MTASNVQSSGPWTLRLKNHKTTVLVHASPLTTIPTIKQTLLHALSETHASGLLNGTHIPKSPSQILLAKPVDPLDIELGWEELSAEEEEESVVKGIGLKDGGVLAFKFKTEEDGEDESDEMEVESKGGWDVVIPKFQDEFGNENEGDVGVRKEFRG